MQALTTKHQLCFTLTYMTHNRKIGATGLSILDIDTSSAPKNKKTVVEVTKWCTELPIADTGVAARKIFLLLEELSCSLLPAEERFAIMEILRTPNKIICTALKQHYIEQISPLTERKLTIANLRETLLTGMADNYKLILEDLHKTTTANSNNQNLLASTILRILYYLNIILICRYQLYSFPQTGIWQEVHLLYKYAKQRNLLELRVPYQFSYKTDASVLEAYTHIILLYATDPYQWRQREQQSLNKAIEMWSLYPTLHEYDQIPAKKPGLYIIDLDKDGPPSLSTFRTAPITKSCIAIDMDKGVQHLKVILERMTHNHLKAKIENPNDPEFSVTAPTIAKLIKIWSQQLSRATERLPTKAQIQIVFGLAAAHFYINDKKEFNPQPNNIRSSFTDNTIIPNKTINNTLNLSLYEVSEEEEEEETNIDKLDIPVTEEKKEIIEIQEAVVSKEQLYKIYDYTIEDINPHGFCIVIRDKSYPPFQAGEIVAFKNITAGQTTWGIGAVRWMRRKEADCFQLGVQILAPFAKAAGIQMLRGEKPASRLLRCLVLPENSEEKTLPMLITTAFPLYSNSIMLYIENLEPIRAVLANEIDASGMYYQYAYSTESGVDLIKQTKEDDDKNDASQNKSEEEKTHTKFDSIWGDL